MYCLALPRLRECDSTCKERRSKNKKQLVWLRGVIYTDCGLVVNWTVALTLTLTKKKGKCYNSYIFLNCILKWIIFYGVGDMLARNFSLYVEM